MEELRRLWARTLRPAEGFRQRALEAPGLWDALWELLLWRSPITFVGSILGFVSFGTLYGHVADPESSLWRTILAAFPEGMDKAELASALARLPELSTLHQMLPWLAMLAPIMVASLWLHDATFDHMGLWLLGGLREKRGFRASLVADAEALKVGAIGAAAGLLADLPGLGLFLTVLLVPVALWFWALRGYALAAWHGCPPWKGVVATFLGVFLAGLMLLVMVLACVAMVMMLL